MNTRRPLSRRVILAGALALIGCGTGGPTDATVVTPVAPTITTQPVSTTAAIGDSAKFTVAITGTTPVTFQWFHSGVARAGDTTAVLRIPVVAATDSGSYYVTITNKVGTVTSSSATLTIVTRVSPTAWRQDGGAGSTVSHTYSSSVADESAIYVFHSGLLMLDTPNVTKSGATTDLVASRTLGQNAAVLAAGGARIYVTRGTIGSGASGSAALYATGTDTKVTLTSGSAATTGTASPAVGASDGATVILTGASVSTAASDAIVVAAPAATSAPVSVTLAGATTVAAGSGTLFNAVGPAKATLTLDGEVVSGRIVADPTATLAVVLQNATTWTGSMAGGALTLDATSGWVVNGNSTLTVLTNPTIVGSTITNINGNGFTVSYVAALPGNAALAGRTFALQGGGQLVPR